MRQSRPSLPNRKTSRRRSHSGTVASLCLALLLGAVSTDASAARQYWVVVGSYQTSQLAEQERADARAMLDRDFEVLGADTPGDYVYRVMAGPFERSTANEFLQQAQQAHYEQAWLLPVSSEEAGLAVAAVENPAEFTSRPGRFDGRYDSGLARKDEQQGELGIPSEVPAEDPEPAEALAPLASEPKSTLWNPDERVEPPVLVQKPPANFNLHRLRRDNGDD